MSRRPPREEAMNIVRGQRSGTKMWMRRDPVVESDLRYKHQQMREGPVLSFAALLLRGRRYGPNLPGLCPLRK